MDFTIFYSWQSDSPNKCNWSFIEDAVEKVIKKLNKNAQLELIGGIAKDDINGGAGDDLLIGGSTLYDTHVQSLKLIMAEWNSTRSYETRIANLRTSAGPVLSGTGVRLKTTGIDRTVFEDTDKDTLNGGDDRDWYFADLGWDDLKDKESNEILN